MGRMTGEGGSWRRLTRHKALLIAAAVVLLPTWATLLVCAVRFHPSLFTVAFHVSNLALITLGFAIARARRPRAQPQDFSVEPTGSAR